MSKEKSGLEAVTTGIDGLNYILRGGLPRNRLYLVQGHPGTGKTTMGLQFLLDGEKKGENGLYVTLSESREELLTIGRSHGWDLESLNIYDLTESGERLLDDSRYTVFHPAEVELDETTKAVLTEVERIDPRRVVFDSLSEMRMLASDPLRFRRQILALKQYFTGRNCTVLLLDDLTAQVSPRQLESIAHGVIKLEYVPTEYGKQRHQMRVVKMRGVDFQSGMHDFNIETGGLIVFPRLGAPEVKEPFEKGALRSEIEDMESLLGGLDYGTSTIITGPAGVGKSTMALMYAHTAAKNGERAAMYLFDESLDTLYKRAASIDLDIRKYVADGLIHIRQIELAEFTPGELAHLVSQDVEKNDTRIVVIDSVNGYLMATPQERFLTMQFHELLSYLNRKGVVSILILGQYGLVGSMHTPIDMSYLADTVVLLRYFEAQGEVRQAISVLKKRTGRHERTIREFRIDAGGIRLGRPLSDFHGVLTGVPVYHGEDKKLMQKDGEGDREQ